MKGRLIIFEGGDGTGKTTQADKLCRFLEGRGREVLHLREPGSTGLGERIRRILLDKPAEGQADITPVAEVFLYMAARAQLFAEVVRPALENGVTVVLERSYFSTYAYQGAGLGMDRDVILRMGEHAVGGVKPARVVLLDMDPAASHERLPPARDRIESRDTAYHRRVREGFLELADRFGDLFRVVDAGGDPVAVHARVLEALENAL